VLSNVYSKSGTVQNTAMLKKIIKPLLVAISVWFMLVSPVILPVILLIGFVIFSIKSYRFRKKSIRTRDGLWIDEVQKQKLRELFLRIENQEKSNSDKKDEKKLQKEFFDISLLPYRRWMDFNSNCKISKSLFSSLIIWILIQIFFLFGFEYFSSHENVIRYFRFLVFSDLIVRNEGISKEFLQISINSIFFTIASYFVLVDLYSNCGEKYLKRPEKVNMNNIDLR